MGKWDLKSYEDDRSVLEEEPKDDGNTYISTPDGGRWIHDDEELARNVVWILNRTTFFQK